jgi:hypothetical protein
VLISYDAAPLKKAKHGWPKLLLSVDSTEDKLPPKTITVEKAKRQGKVTFPLRVDPHKSWRVRASYLAPGYRSEIVVRAVD